MATPALVQRVSAHGRTWSGSGWLWIPHGRASPPPPVPSVLRPAFVRRQGDSLARIRAGFVVRWTTTTFGSQPAIGYNIYANTGAGDPINYSTPIATVYTLSYTTGALSYPGDWKLAVRAFNLYGEEKNLDCEVEIILDGNGNDITNRPIAPMGLRAFATSSGGIRVEWAYPKPLVTAKTPTGFNVYIGTGGTPNYSSAAATISYALGIASMFVANLSGLTDGTTYTIGVRAYNTVAQEPNTNTVNVTASATGPASVDGLSGGATVGG
jgi:hypothetical protein